jgi:hypothetical protein
VTLLNGLLALGSLAFTIPLAIHLFFRSRFRVVEWGAMFLLDGAIRVNHRQSQLRQILLLLLRCLIPVLLAFCLARPVLTWFRGLPGDDPQSVVLALDDSLSMAARDAQGVSRIERARQIGLDLLAELSRGDEVILLRSGNPADAAVVTGRSDAARWIGQIRAAGGPVDLPTLARRALQAADSAAHAQRHIVLISDFQAVDLDQPALDGLIALATAWHRDLPSVDSPSRDDSSRSLMNLGNDSQSLRNVFVESITLQTPSVVAGMTARFTAELRNESDIPINGMLVTWSVDGQTVLSSPVSIAARSSGQVQWDHRFDVLGAYEIAVSIDSDDALTEDNRRNMGVTAIEEIKVLLVDGSPSNEPLQGAVDFLRLALSPFSLSRASAADAIRTTVIDAAGIVSQLRATEASVLVVANVANLDSNTKRAIADFVDAGGSLVIFDGDTVTPDSYNEAWRTGPDLWQLPAVMGNTAIDSGNVPVVVNAYSAWAELAGPTNSLFADVTRFRYRPLTLRDEDLESATDASKPAQVLLATADGSVLVIAADRGRGRVVQFAFPSNDDWTDLPLRPSYVPLMQQLILDLAGSNRSRSVGNVEPPVSESILRGADPNRLHAVADAMDAAVHADPAELAAAIQARRAGREIWPWLLGLLVVVMIAEVFVQQGLSGAVRGDSA